MMYGFSPAWQSEQTPPTLPRSSVPPPKSVNGLLLHLSLCEALGKLRVDGERVRALRSADVRLVRELCFEEMLHQVVLAAEPVAILSFCRIDEPIEQVSAQDQLRLFVEPETFT